MHFLRAFRPALAAVAGVVVAWGLCSPAAQAQPPLDASGCYTKLKTGEYVCPRKRPAAAAPMPGHQPGGNPAHHIVKQTLQKPMAGGCFVAANGRTYTVTQAGKRSYSKC
jgi:hypothetical protein